MESESSTQRDQGAYFKFDLRPSSFFILPPSSFIPAFMSPAASLFVFRQLFFHHLPVFRDFRQLRHLRQLKTDRGWVLSRVGYNRVRPVIGRHLCPVNRGISSGIRGARARW